MKRGFIPNILTFLNLSLGVLSLIATVKGEYLNSGLFILAAGLVDRYDGRIARLLNAESPLGKELDSLSDLVSFGVAPALQAYFMFNLADYSFLGLIPIIIFPVSGSYRLARYNASSFDGVFLGLPITIAGCALTLFSLLLRNNLNLNFLIIFIMVAFSYLMVSTIKLPKR